MIHLNIQIDGVWTALTFDTAEDFSDFIEDLSRTWEAQWQ